MLIFLVVAVGLIAWVAMATFLIGAFEDEIFNAEHPYWLFSAAFWPIAMWFTVPGVLAFKLGERLRSLHDSYQDAKDF